jgi:hypothetical protein
MPEEAWEAAAASAAAFRHAVVLEVPESHEDADADGDADAPEQVWRDDEETYSAFARRHPGWDIRTTAPVAQVWDAVAWVKRISATGAQARYDGQRKKYMSTLRAFFGPVLPDFVPSYSETPEGSRLLRLVRQNEAAMAELKSAKSVFGGGGMGGAIAELERLAQ